MTLKRLRIGARVVARLGTLALGLSALCIAMSGVPASASSFTHTRSMKVALIPQNGPVPPNGPDGIMPIASYVSGLPAESFAGFSFTKVGLGQITSDALSQFDTVALIQVKVANLTSSARAALAQFIANGGKLIIHDSDETKLNDYSWVLPGSSTTRVGAGCEGCGGTSGSSTITNSSLISTNPADPSYVSLGDLAKFTDAIGDANLLVSTDPRWFALAEGKNSNANNESGAQIAFANNNGLVIYNGFDTDFVKTTPSDPWRCNQPALGFKCPSGSTPKVDWLAHMWYSELTQGWGGMPGPASATELPTVKPIVKIGALLAPSLAGLASNRKCLAKGRLFLRLTQLSHLHRRKVVQVDVYLDGRHVVHQRRHLVNVTLKTLPRHGAFTVEIIATTNRGYHLIAKQRYRTC
jgi:hypothetical protein